MLLDLSRIRAPRTPFAKTYQPEVFGAEEAYRVAEPVALSFEILKKGDRFRLTGEVHATLELPCSRCLDPFRWPVDSRFDLNYQPQSANTGSGELEIDNDDLATAYYENDEIDLSQLICEQFFLALPMKPLCRDDCQGLCPICGQNRNRMPCACRREWTDPRLEALKGIGKHES